MQCFPYVILLFWSQVTHAHVQELKGKVALSLDAWTSSNQHAFLVIVAHYITNDGQLGMYINLCVRIILQIGFIEELLIDFRELVGEHSGENMAEVVWETLRQYGLVGRVSLFPPSSTSDAVNTECFVIDHCICHG